MNPISGVFKRSLVVLVCAVLGACAGYFNKPLDVAAKQRIRSIAVIATYDDSLNYSFVGLTVFSNTTGQISVPDWQLGTVFEQRVADDLRGRVAVKPVAGTGVAAAFRAARTSDNRTMKRYSALIQGLPDQGVDAYLLVDLVTPESSAGYPSGYGILRRGSFGVYDNFEYQALGVHLFEAKTGAELAYGLPCVPDGEHCREPNLKVGRNDWPEEAASVTAAQKGKMKADFVAMTRGLADSTVTLLGLVQ